MIQICDFRFAFRWICLGVCLQATKKGKRAHVFVTYMAVKGGFLCSSLVLQFRPHDVDINWYVGTIRGDQVATL